MSALLALLSLPALFISTNAGVFHHQLSAATRYPHKWLREDDLTVQYKLRMAAKNSAGEHVKDYDDVLYVAEVQLGTPAQSFRVDMDTGSANFWVVDKGCRIHACSLKRKFDQAASSTYIANGQYLAINYGGGLSMVGFLGTDQLCLGDSNFCISNQTFGQGENVNGRFFTRVPTDGVLGLGWPAIAVDHVTPPMQNLLPQLDLPLFNVWLNHVGGHNRSNNGGLITYGALDSVNCGAVNWVPLTSQTFWQFSIASVSAGTFSSNTAQDAISDTGTSFIGGPDVMIDSIAQQAGATFNYTTLLYMLPCNANTTAPALVFTVNGQQYSVAANNYLEPFFNVPGRCYLQFFKFNGFGFGPQWILGGAFMRNFCQTYDIGNRRLGFSTSTPSF